MTWEQNTVAAATNLYRYPFGLPVVAGCFHKQLLPGPTVFQVGIFYLRVIRSARTNDIAVLSCNPASFCVVAATGQTFIHFMVTVAGSGTHVASHRSNTSCKAVLLSPNGQRAVRSSGALCIRHISRGVVVSVRDTSYFLEQVTMYCAEFCDVRVHDPIA
jgi:hypothetical protein